jgi:putative ABC transport system permease protein
MHIQESCKMAIATLASNKLRSALTMLGIIIGNASVVAMVGIGQGANKLVVQQVETLGANQISIFPKPEDSMGLVLSDTKLNLGDAELIRTQVPSVTAVAPVSTSRYPVSFGPKRTTVNIYGTTADFLVVQNMKLAQGKMLGPEAIQQESQQAVLGSDTAKKLFGATSPLGQEVLINNITFTVIGVLQPKGAALGESLDQLVLIPLPTMANRILGTRSPYGIPISYIQVTAKDQSQLRAAGFQIINILTRAHGRQDVALFANRSVQESLGQITGALSLLLLLTAAISLIVGGIGIMNIMLVSVTERTREIGLRKAIGANQQDVLSQFLIEAIILSAIGGGIGIGIGIVGIMPLAWVTPLKPEVPPGAIAVALGISGGIGLVFGVIPARRAAQLDPIVALRN